MIVLLIILAIVTCIYEYKNDSYNYTKYEKRVFLGYMAVAVTICCFFLLNVDVKWAMKLMSTVNDYLMKPIESIFK